MAPTLKWRNTLIIIALLFILASVPAICEGDDDAEDKTGDDVSECQPYQADSCFNDVNENLLCHVVSRAGRNCTTRNAKDLCVGLDDALNCTSEIVDTDCNAKDGRAVFDNWQMGLRGVQDKLCLQNDFALLDDLLKSNNCWNFRTFIRCVENKANLTHISDLLTTQLDPFECNLLQMVVTLCNEKAERSRLRCRGIAEAVNVAVAAFFSSSPCAGAMSANCDYAKSQQLTYSARHSTGTAVISTLAVMMFFVGIVAFVLIKRNVITLNPNFTLMEEPEGVEDAREDYGRFL